MATESGDKCRARELWVRVTTGDAGEGSGCSEATRDSWWRLIRQRYGEPSRHHHNLDHLNHMAELWAEYAEHLSNPRAVALALFFQYLEYDPKSQDNEERCIEAFRRFAEEARIPTNTKTTRKECAWNTVLFPTPSTKAFAQRFFGLFCRFLTSSQRSPSGDYTKSVPRATLGTKLPSWTRNGLGEARQRKWLNAIHGATQHDRK